MLHKSIPLADRHAPHSFEYANAGARTGASGFVAADVGKLALQTDTNALYILTATTPTWLAVGGGASDHGALTGLADDDHTQYALADGSRGTFAATGHTHAGVYQPADADLTTWAGITPGANVGTFLATPTLANLNSAVSDANLVAESVSTAASYTAGGTTTIAYVQDTVYYATAATGATTWAITGLPASGTIASWSIELTNGGSQTQTWFTGTDWDGGLAPTLTAAGVDILTFYTRDGGTTIRGFLVAADSK